MGIENRTKCLMNRKKHNSAQIFYTCEKHYQQFPQINNAVAIALTRRKTADLI
jgi:hypothetical protein